MILEQEDLLQIKNIMIETIIEVVPPLVKPIIREEVRKEVRKEVGKQIRKELKIFKKELLEEIAIESKRQHQETRNYIFDRMEREYTTKYEFGVQVERIDKLEKNIHKSKGGFIVSEDQTEENPSKST